jgi:hypothetical protein
MTPATSVPEPAALARAFLALAEGAPDPAPPRRAPAAAVVLLTAVVIAMSTPLVWAGLLAEQPDTAVLTPPRVALVDGDDDAPGGP